MADLQQARAAKAHLRTTLARTRGVRGIGLSRREDGYALRVNLERTTADGEIPHQVDGVPVEIKVVGALAAR